MLVARMRDSITRAPFGSGCAPQRAFSARSSAREYADASTRPEDRRYGQIPQAYVSNSGLKAVLPSRPIRIPRERRIRKKEGKMKREVL